MQKYIQKGHTLWIDNWYSSPKLYDHLHKNKTNVCGTVRKNRKGMPKFSNKLKKGETDTKHTENMMVVRWMDRREVCMLTTLHEHTMTQTGKTDRHTNQLQIKPQCVIQYNKWMGAVDRSDMMITSIECVRKSLKWYRKSFFHLLDITILNLQTLYNVKTGNNISLSDYHLNLIRQIFETFHTPRPSKRGRPSAGDQPLRLTSSHFPSLVPPTTKKKKMKQGTATFAVIHLLQREKEKKVGTCVLNATLAFVYNPVLKSTTH